MKDQSYMMEYVIKRLIKMENDLIKQVVSQLTKKDFNEQDLKRLTKLTTNNNDDDDWYDLAFDGITIGRFTRHYGVNEKWFYVDDKSKLGINFETINYDKYDDYLHLK